ncbi:hypothetical protein E3N88_32323 [Mikania micrantha]|uniref:Uncharacterized protein n=1 Tax=Mikania micrantha TaxID=192012 RepID=A0A5N6M866_9ASTR|nr:hypothetical protein E3N88_32323 [Mikania micrantha]
MLTGGHNECNFDGNAGSAMTCGGKRKQSSFDNNRDANRNPGKRPASDDLTKDSRRRINDIVAQVDAEMARRAQMLTRDRYWGWLPNIIQDWVLGERVPPLRH